MERDNHDDKIRKAEGFSNEQIADFYKALASPMKPRTQKELVDWGKARGIPSPAAGGLSEFLGKKEGKNTNKKAKVLVIRYLIENDQSFRKKLDYNTPTSAPKPKLIAVNPPSSPYKGRRIGPSSKLVDDSEDEDESASDDEEDLLEKIFELDFEVMEKVGELIENEDPILENLIARCKSIGDEGCDVFEAIIQAVDLACAWPTYGELLLLEEFKTSLVDNDICGDDGVWPLSYILSNCFEEGVDDEQLYTILSTNRFCTLPDLLENLVLLKLVTGTNFDRGDILRNVLVDAARKRKDFFDDWTSETFEQLEEFIDEDQADVLKKVLPSEALAKWDQTAAKIKQVQEDSRLLDKLLQLEKMTVELQAKSFEIQDLMKDKQEANNQNESLSNILKVKKRIEVELLQLTNALGSLRIIDNEIKNPIYGPQISHLKIASWNIKSLGVGKTVRNFKNIISALDCDILAVQELRAPPYNGTYGNMFAYNVHPEATNFFNDMHQQGFVSTFPKDSTGNRENNTNANTSEFMPVFFKPQKLHLISHDYISNADSLIAREDPLGYAYAPTVYEFVVIGTQFQFCLIVVHLCPGSDQISETKRMKDLRLINAWITAKKLPAIVVGDCNARNQAEAKKIPAYLSSEARRFYSINHSHAATTPTGNEYDFILAPETLNVDEFCVVDPDNISDHYLIQGTLEIPINANPSGINNNNSTPKKRVKMQL